MKPRQYLYLLQVEGKSWYKIGITNDLEARIKDINKSLKKRKVVLQIKIKTYSASRKERFLHDLFACSRFTWRGSGKTEYFSLNWLEVIFLMGWFWWFAWRGWIGMALALGMIGFLYIKTQG